MTVIVEPFIPPHSTPACNQQVILVSRPLGIPQASDFALAETPVTGPEEGQILVRNLYLSVDPAQRGWAADINNYAAPVAIGSVMRALGVGIVVESRSQIYECGDIVYGWTGWQDYCCMARAQILSTVRAPTNPISCYAGILGINGMTAWLAFNRFGRPVSGETVLVTTAAGAVGSVVGQLASRANCRPLGLTGNQEKVASCIERFGYDAAFNYKEDGWTKWLSSNAADGVDILFDNVGGEILDQAIRLMRPGGRIVQCGTASIQSWLPPPTGLRNEREILSKRLSWNGFVIFDHSTEFPAAIEGLTSLLQEGCLTYDEDIETGIEVAPDALRRLYAGENTGKKLIFIG